MAQAHESRANISLRCKLLQEDSNKTKGVFGNSLSWAYK